MENVQLVKHLGSNLSVYQRIVVENYCYEKSKLQTSLSGELGSFWTLEPPNHLGDVIGGTAVMPEWNGFTKVIEYTVPSEGIKVWRGKAASQPISEIPNLQSSGHSLPGGKIQIFINDIVKTDEFENSIKNVTTTYKNW